MAIKSALAIAMIALMSTSAHAEEVFDYGGVKIDIAVSRTYSTCFAAAGGNDLRMAVCMSAETVLWDQRLNAAYAKLRAQLPKNNFAALQAFQRLWVADRDATCQDNGENGTSGRVAADGCVLRMVAVRAAELESRAANGN